MTGPELYTALLPTGKPEGDAEMSLALDDLMAWANAEVVADTPSYAAEDCLPYLQQWETGCDYEADTTLFPELADIAGFI